MNPVTTRTIQGAGLAFPLASLIFVFSGQLAWFALIPVGAILGWCFGYWQPRLQPAITSSQAAFSRRNTSFARVISGLKVFIHPNLFVRVFSLVGLGVVLFVLAWFVGYFLLPEGAFRSGSDALMTTYKLEKTTTSIFQEWIGLLRVNLFVASLIVISSLLMKVNGIPFGYVVAFYNLLGYGLFVGTNSFAIPYPERMAPSFDILARSGLYEMLALVLLAAATCCWPFFEVKHLFRTNPEKVSPQPRIAPVEIAVALAGVVILMAANWREATMIVTAITN